MTTTSIEYVRLCRDADCYNGPSTTSTLGPLIQRGVIGEVRRVVDEHHVHVSFPGCDRDTVVDARTCEPATFFEHFDQRVYVDRGKGLIRLESDEDRI